MLAATMRRWRLLACTAWLPGVALAGLSHCGGPNAAHPQPSAPASDPDPSGATSLEAILGQGAADAGTPGGRVSRVLTVTRCLVSATPCQPEKGEVALRDSYHVVFGSGRGAVQSRLQVEAELYNELRYRTSSGEHLNARVRYAADGGAVPRAPVTKAAASKDDKPGGEESLPHCAQELLDLVDDAGEVTVDVLHGDGASTCMVSLGELSADGTRPRCLVAAPERGVAPSRKGGIPF
jgi:hypothetical protein